MSCLSLPYLVTLISFIRCPKKLFTVIRSASTLFDSLLYLETKADAVWVYVIFVRQHYLKV